MAQESKIGLEIHGYLKTKEKLFCKNKAIRHGVKQNIRPNTNICPICTGQPGSKPMLPNSKAIKKAIQIALMLNCNINKKLIWQRKHYDWPDLPKGYQISMSGSYSFPLGEKGKFENIGITEIHLEEDPAAWNPETGAVDYNRSGLPLVEIVTEPEFSSLEEVEGWLKKLVLTMSYIKALDKNAGIKADVNVSTKYTNFQERIEIKNLNSIANIKKAIKYEVERQKKEPVKRETRRFDEKTEKTIRMRSKEQAEDYRFIPDPDLPLIKLDIKKIKKIKSSLPESPKEKLDKLIKQHKIKEKEAKILAKNLDIVEFFESISEKISPKFALPWITIELLRVLNYNKKTLDQVDIEPEHFIELLQAVKSGKITELKAKSILNDFIPKSFSIKSKIKKEAKIDGKSEIEKIVRQILEKNKEAVLDYRGGKQEVLNFLIGQIMKESNRRADYKTAKEILLRMLR